MAGSFSSLSDPSMKWHIALSIGLPVVVGVGYWYLIRKGRHRKAIADNDGSHKTGETLAESDTSKKANAKPQTLLEEATSLKEKGNKFFKSGQYEEAIKYYRKAIEICPKSEVVSLATFYQNIAAAYEHLKNYEEVKNACNEALSLNPKYIKALSRRSKAYEHTGDLAHAFEDLTAVCLLENFESESSLTAADALLLKLSQKDAKEAMAKQVFVMPSKNFVSTYFSSFVNDPIKPFLTKTDGDFTKGFLKGIDLMKKKEYELVIPACTEEINMTEAESLYKHEALLLRGTLYHLCGDYTSAMADFNCVIENEKVDPKMRVNALIKRASMKIQHNPALGFEDFKTALKIDPNNADIYHQRGQIHVVAEKIKEAAEDFEMVVKLNPNHSITEVHKCYTDYRCAVMAGDHNKVEAALERFEQLIKEHPQCSECYSLYAQVLSGEGQFEKADNLYQKALKVNPQNSVLLVFRALIKLKRDGDAEGAIKILNESIELDDKCAFAFETLGTIETQRGNLERGIELFKKAMTVARTEIEMLNFCTLKNAAETNKKVMEKLDIKQSDIPSC